MVKTDDHQAEKSKKTSMMVKKFKGVRMRSWGSWVSEIRAPNQKTRIWLGSYSTPEAAARAYDAALLCLKGSSAAAPSLNFPTSSFAHYHNYTSSAASAVAPMSPKSIQRVAAAAAANANANTDVTIHQPPPPPQAALPQPSELCSSFSSSSMASSPSTEYCSQPSDQTDDDVSLEMVQSLIDYNYYEFGFGDSTAAFGCPPPPMFDDFYEGDIRLWSFAD
ncbi:Ethylene-responsive transcription factor ERF012 [Linum grandiflorum]